MAKRILDLVILTIVSFMASAQAPEGYYLSCEGKSGKALLVALYDIISPHTVVSYGGLWNVYYTSDVREDGTIWDMYSTKHWTPGSEQCGNYSNVGDCYNREHSFPKSWFGEAAPMESDAFHIYPTDGKVNGQRSNYPYGECSNGEVLQSSGDVQALGRLGTSTFAGYTGIVFEPDDEYKGDFARSYFYMAACYNDKIGEWSSDMLAGNDYPCYAAWAVNLLLKWHRQDPVSQKEIDRNNVIYGYQNNRNPFIDYPALAEHIWGVKTDTGWTLESEIVPPEIGNDSDVGGDEDSMDVTFVEDFERDATGMDTYSPSNNYQGTASLWKFSNAGMWGTDVSRDAQSVRYGKTSSSYIEMAQDKTAGAGEISFYVKKWGNDIDATLSVEYSVDQGATWTSAGLVSITDASQYVKKSVRVNIAGKIRLRFAQMAGARFNIDDIAISNYSEESLVRNLHASKLSMSGFDGCIVIKALQTSVVSIYDINGRELYKTLISEGETVFELPQGLYIVSASGEVHRVLVK